MRNFYRLSLFALAVCCTAVAVPALANESTTSLPLPPGATLDQAVDSPICGKPAHMVLYDVPASATVATYIAFFKSTLPNGHYVHASWMDRPQEEFYSADGKRGVTITGVPKGARVYMLTYAKFASPLTTRQEDAFSPNDPNCT